MSNFALSQALIGIVFFIDLASFQFRERRRVLMCLCCAAFLIGVHFWLLEIYTAAVLGMIASLRFGTAIFFTSSKLQYLFLSLVAMSLLFTYAGPLSILGTSGSLLSTVAAFQATDRRFRQLMMASSTIWIVHNILAFTPAAVVLECFFLGSNLVGYYRFYLRSR